MVENEYHDNDTIEVLDFVHTHLDEVEVHDDHDMMLVLVVHDEMVEYEYKMIFLEKCSGMLDDELVELVQHHQLLYVVNNNDEMVGEIVVDDDVVD